jgi:fumarylpyruvate hydrolase
VGKAGSDVPVASALGLVYGYAVGMDLTRRDLQLAARDRGRPWEPGKAFDRSAPLAPIRPSPGSPPPPAAAIWLDVNGQRRQSATIDQMIWSVPEILAALSRLFELSPGDLVFTGTPAGVGRVERGDRLAGGIDGLGTLTIGIAS